MDDIRLEDLINKIKDGKATNSEKDEYMKFLYDNNRISVERYNNYKKSRNKNKIAEYSILAGLGLLAAILVTKLLSKD